MLPVHLSVPSLGLTLLCGALGLRFWRSHRHHQRCVRLCHRIADELSQKQEPELVIERVFKAVLEHTGAVIGILSYRCDASAPFTVLRVSGLPAEVLAPGTRLGSGQAGWECEDLEVTGERQLLHRGLREALWEHAGIRLDRRQNMLCIPVADKTQVRGLLQLVSGPGDCFSAAQLNELSGVGFYLDAAINNARLIETIGAQRDAAEVLYEIGLTISRFLDLDEILGYTVEQARRLLGSNLTWYLDYPGGSGTLAIIRKASGQAPPEFHTGASIPLVGRVAGLLAPNGGEPRFLVLDDIGEHRGRDQDGALRDDSGLFCDPQVQQRFIALGVRSALLVPVADRSEVRGLLCNFATEPDAYGESAVNLMQRLANQALIAQHSADLAANRQAYAVMQERERLSNELHDNMSQVINGLSLELHSIAKLAGKTESVEPLLQRLEKIHRVLGDAKAAIRQAIYELRLPDGRSLWDNLRDFAARFEGWHDLRIRTDLPEGTPPLPLDHQREVIRIIQEALWNLRKHSGCSQGSLSGAYDPATGRLSLTVADTGIGVTQEALSQGQGVATMRDRAARLGGTLHIGRGNPGGTTVTLELYADASRG